MQGYTDHADRATGNVLEDLSQEELRALIWPEPEPKAEHNRRAYDVRFLREFGTEAGLLLSRLVYRVGKSHDPQGRVYLTKEQIRDETGLSRYKVDRTRGRLAREGVLEYDNDTRHVKDKDSGKLRQRSSHTGHYRVDMVALAKRLGVEPGEPSINGSHSEPSTAQIADLRLLKAPTSDHFHIQGGDTKGINRGEYEPPPVSRNRKKGSQTPPEGIAAFKVHENSLIRKWWELGLEWDFTRDRRPPMEVFLSLGGDDDERRKCWKRMQKAARDAVETQREETA